MSTTSLLGDHEHVKDDIEEGSAALVSELRSRTGKYRKPTLLPLAVSCVAALFMMYSLRGVISAVLLKTLYGAPYGMGSLPAHYILPSGDKIPSVALGKYSCQEVPVFK